MKLDVAANPGQLVTAESRVIALASITDKTGILPSPLPWEAPVEVTAAEKQKRPQTVAAAVTLLEVDVWKGKDRSYSAALRGQTSITGPVASRAASGWRICCSCWLCSGSITPLWMIRKVDSQALTAV